jgi:hypothetical protein
MFRVTCGDLALTCMPDGLPSTYALYRDHALLADEIDLRAPRRLCFVGVGAADAAWPSLVVAQTDSPDGDAGFHPGALLVPETGRLFLGAGERVLIYALDPPARLSEGTADTGFWRWARHADTVVMSAELELAAWDLAGRKLWSTFVEPPWEYRVRDGLVHLDVMAAPSTFPLHDGPR